MICIICRQAEIIDGRLSVNFERGEMNFAINNVPVEICSGCGEAYVDEEVAVRNIELFEFEHWLKKLLDKIPSHIP